MLPRVSRSKQSRYARYSPQSEHNCTPDDLAKHAPAPRRPTRHAHLYRLAPGRVGGSGVRRSMNQLDGVGMRRSVAELAGRSAVRLLRRHACGFNRITRRRSASATKASTGSVCHASNNARGDPNRADVAFQDWPRLLWADFTLATFQEHMFDQCSAPDRLTDRGAGRAAASVRGDAAERRAGPEPGRSPRAARTDQGCAGRAKEVPNE